MRWKKMYCFYLFLYSKHVKTCENMFLENRVSIFWKSGECSPKITKIEVWEGRRKVDPLLDPLQKCVQNVHFSVSMPFHANFDFKKHEKTWKMVKWGRSNYMKNMCTHLSLSLLMIFSCFWVKRVNLFILFMILGTKGSDRPCTNVHKNVQNTCF
jgi:hypothetical protein